MVTNWYWGGTTAAPQRQWLANKRTGQSAQHSAAARRARTDRERAPTTPTLRAPPGVREAVVA